MHDAADALDGDGLAFQRLGRVRERCLLGDAGSVGDILAQHQFDQRLVDQVGRWRASAGPAAAARRNTGPVPMVKSALPAITALGEATPTRMRCETFSPPSCRIRHPRQ
jgi:hypothetical protein